MFRIIFVFVLNISPANQNIVQTYALIQSYFYVMNNESINMC